MGHTWPSQLHGQPVASFFLFSGHRLHSSSQCSMPFDLKGGYMQSGDSLSFLSLLSDFGSDFSSLEELEGFCPHGYFHDLREISIASAAA